MKLSKLLNEERVYDDFNISKEKFKEIPKELHRQDCDTLLILDNKFLKSIINSPIIVTQSVFLKRNPELESLKGFPKTVFHEVYISNCPKIYHDLWRLLQSKIRGTITIADSSMNISHQNLNELNRLANLYKNQPDKILKFQSQLMDLGFYDDFQ